MQYISDSGEQRDTSKIHLRHLVNSLQKDALTISNRIYIDTVHRELEDDEVAFRLMLNYLGVVQLLERYTILQQELAKRFPTQYYNAKIESEC